MSKLISDPNYYIYNGNTITINTSSNSTSSGSYYTFDYIPVDTSRDWYKLNVTKDTIPVAQWYTFQIPVAKTGVDLLVDGEPVRVLPALTPNKQYIVTKNMESNRVRLISVDNLLQTEVTVALVSTGGKETPPIKIKTYDFMWSMAESIETKKHLDGTEKKVYCEDQHELLVL